MDGENVNEDKELVAPDSVSETIDSDRFSIGYCFLFY